MTDLFSDLETFSPRELKYGTHQYAEKAEVMLWSYALDDDIVKVWDIANRTVHWQDEISGMWESVELPPKMKMPSDLQDHLRNSEVAVWFQNGGHFDFVVLKHAMPHIQIPMERRRDTMVQAFSHALPGALEKLGEVLGMAEEKRKIADGKRLVRLFCKPDADGKRATRATHPKEWQRFVEYAAGDIVTMREAHRKIPKWNYKPGLQMDLWHLDCRINERGFAVDLDLARAAVAAAEKERASLNAQTRKATDNAVQAVTQRDAVLAYILESYGVELPDMQSDTLERRLDDPDIPEPVKDLIRIRLQGARNTASKFKAVLRGVSADGRLRGCFQFRGAGRTGRWAHRLVQPGNLLRPTMSVEAIEQAIAALKAECADLIYGNVMEVIGNTVRGVIIAPPGKKLVQADLSNIEGRMAAWLAGEAWKLEAFRKFDAGEGVDLYILAYAKSFNVAPEDVPKKGPERQIGKVEELMFQYGGGVGAWLTGAATYGIDLDKMTEQVWDVLPAWAKDEATDFMEWLQEQATTKLREKLAENAHFDEHRETNIKIHAAELKARMGLPERTFIACDAIKRLWRKAHPAISSYWKELEDKVREAIETPGVTLQARKVKIRRDGAWLRIGLPSGRALCYPNPRIEKDGSISYTGFNQYTRQWGKVTTYSGKLYENLVQGAAADQFAECMPIVEKAGYPIVMHVHDELLCEVPDTEEYTADELGSLMCSNLSWNSGLPLASDGYEGKRYKK